MQDAGGVEVSRGGPGARGRVVDFATGQGRPEVSKPPATRTRPSARRVAVWEVRAVIRVPVTVQVPGEAARDGPTAPIKHASNMANKTETTLVGELTLSFAISLSSVTWRVSLFDLPSATNLEIQPLLPYTYCIDYARLKRLFSGQFCYRGVGILFKMSKVFPG